MYFNSPQEQTNIVRITPGEGEISPPVNIFFVHFNNNLFLPWIILLQNGLGAKGIF